MSEPLIPKHGGYRKLKSFQIAQLAYDVTVRFCDRYIDRRSRTHDQMVQAARSGVQNIAEGSQASGTSKKFELKLTSVARASLEELKLDYEDFLRQRGLEMLEPQHPVLIRFKERRCQTLDELQQWVAEERRNGIDTDKQGQTQTDRDSRTNTDTNVNRPVLQVKESVNVSDGPCESLSSACLVANATLSLLNLACYFLDRQIVRLAADFENEGGFTERLYRVRSTKRRNK
jgi:four helix bundle suffix protein